MAKPTPVDEAPEDKAARLLDELKQDRLKAQNLLTEDPLWKLAKDAEAYYFGVLGGRYVGPNMVKTIYNHLKADRHRLIDFETAANAVVKHLYKLKHWTERDRYYNAVLRTIREERKDG